MNDPRPASPSSAPESAIRGEHRRTAARWPRVLFPALILVVMLAAAVYFGRAGGSSAAGGSLWLDVATDPPGASVFLNGRLAGAAPLRINGLYAGVYGVRLEKEGRLPVVRRVCLDGLGAELRESLTAVPVARLKVAIEPDGAEVLLDGEIVGHTPLALAAAPVGIHELVVRKANFGSFTQRLMLRPEETTEFSGFALEDTILKMLQQRVLVEPWRVSYFTELGHYLFVGDQQTGAAEAMVQALALATRKPDYPPDLSAEDRAVENRLRGDDQRRLDNTIQNMWHWHGKDSADFRKRLEQPDAMLLQIALRLDLRELNHAVSTANRLLEACPGDSATLTQAARRLIALDSGWPKDERGLMRDCVEKLIRAALTAAPNDEARRACRYDLAGCLVRREQYAEAEKLYREVLAGTADAATRELRRLGLASALFGLKRYDEARQIYAEAVAAATDPAAKDQHSLGLAACLAALGRPAEARALYERLARSPSESVKREALAALKELPPAPR